MIGFTTDEIQRLADAAFEVSKRRGQNLKPFQERQDLAFSDMVRARRNRAKQAPMHELVRISQALGLY